MEVHALESYSAGEVLLLRGRVRLVTFVALAIRNKGKWVVTACNGRSAIKVR